MNKQKVGSKRKMFAGVTVVIIVIGIMVFMAIGTSLWGVELAGVEQELAQVEAENRRLTSEIVSQTSLTEIYEQSEALGYVKPEHVVYVEGDKPVAELRQ